jgi:uncharacterized protein GlcG (DUF336 family)
MLIIQTTRPHAEEPTMTTATRAAVTRATISAAAARLIIDAALGRAEELGVPSVIAVIDDSGNLTALCRMDGAPVVSITVAQNKAYTALLGLPTGDLYHALTPDPALLAGVLHTPRMAVFGGGLPIVADGALIGAVGVGGGTVEQDIDCARAGLAALAPDPAAAPVPA